MVEEAKDEHGGRPRCEEGEGGHGAEPWCEKNKMLTETIYGVIKEVRAKRRVMVRINRK